MFFLFEIGSSEGRTAFGSERLLAWVQSLNYHHAYSIGHFVSEAHRPVHEGTALLKNKQKQRNRSLPVLLLCHLKTPKS